MKTCSYVDTPIVYLYLVPHSSLLCLHLLLMLCAWNLTTSNFLMCLFVFSPVFFSPFRAYTKVRQFGYVYFTSEYLPVKHDRHIYFVREVIIGCTLESQISFFFLFFLLIFFETFFFFAFSLFVNKDIFMITYQNGYLMFMVLSTSWQVRNLIHTKCPILDDMQQSSLSLSK